MQPFGPRVSTLGTTYGAAAVKAALQSGGRERWVFDRLDSGGNYLSDLTPFVEKRNSSPVIAHDTTMAVKRTLTIRFRGDVPLFRANVARLSDQIAAHYQILMPDGGWVDFRLGKFVVLPAGGETHPSRVWHDMAGVDYGQLLLDYSFPQSFGIPAGSGVSAINQLLAIPGASTQIRAIVPDLGRAINQPMAWDAGMSRLKAANDLFAALNYFPAWLDENGFIRSLPIPDWNTVMASSTFDLTQAGSTVYIPMRQSVDWSGAGNIQTVYVEDPRRAAFSATYTNANPNSPVSTVNFHPKTLPPIKDSTIPDVATAYLVARHRCQLAARVFQSWSITTSAWPLSQDQDVYMIRYSDPDDGPQALSFVETAWAMTCKAGAGTSHTLQQLVPA